MFVNLLSHSGYEVRSCQTGKLGLKEAGEFAPHLILLDIGLPDVSGLEVLRKIKAHPSSRKTQVILITGASGLEMKIEGFQTGADDYISKPINTRELLLKVDHCFSTLMNQERELELRQKELFQTILNTLTHEFTAPLAAIRNEVRLSKLSVGKGTDSDWSGGLQRIDSAAEQIELVLIKLQSDAGRAAKEIFPGVHVFDLDANGIQPPV